MNAQEIVTRFAKKVEVDNDHLCFTCHAMKANWLADLQDVLEDAGVSLERFCEINSLFKVERKRLRLKHSIQCVNISHIRATLENLQASLDQHV